MCLFEYGDWVIGVEVIIINLNNCKNFNYVDIL